MLSLSERVPSQSAPPLYHNYAIATNFLDATKNAPISLRSDFHAATLLLHPYIIAAAGAAATTRPEGN